LRAATSIALINFAKFFARRLSMIAFLCFVVAHLEWPDMAKPQTFTLVEQRFLAA
jgi:hypothetical protein